MYGRPPSSPNGVTSIEHVSGCHDGQVGAQAGPLLELTENLIVVLDEFELEIAERLFGLLDRQVMAAGDALDHALEQTEVLGE
jgi:hypothetical protein